MMTQTNTWLGLGQTRGQGNSGRLRWWWGWWGVSVWGLASSSRAVVIRSDSGAQSQQTLYHRHYLAQYIIHFMNICAMRNHTTLFLSFLLQWGLTHYYLFWCWALTARPSRHYVSSAPAVRGEPSHMQDVTLSTLRTRDTDTQWHNMLIRDMAEDDIEIAIKVSVSSILWTVTQTAIRAYKYLNGQFGQKR